MGVSVGPDSVSAERAETPGFRAILEKISEFLALAAGGVFQNRATVFLVKLDTLVSKQKQS